MDIKSLAVGLVLIPIAITSASCSSTAVSSQEQGATTAGADTATALPPTSAAPAPVQNTAPAPVQTTAPPTEEATDDITCAEFEGMSQKQRLAVAGVWRDNHPKLVGNPMYASMSPGGKASYLSMSFDAYCSQAGHAKDNLRELTM